MNARLNVGIELPVKGAAHFTNPPLSTSQRNTRLKGETELPARGKPHHITNPQVSKVL
jgi:hypothetical protein